MAIGEIDGDYITGICFVGFENMVARVSLFVAPLCATVLMSTYIIVRGKTPLKVFTNPFWAFCVKKCLVFLKKE